MKLTDIKNLPETINRNALMRQAGFSPEALRKRVTRNSPELTPEESNKFLPVLNSIISSITKLKKRSKG